MKPQQIILDLLIISWLAIFVNFESCTCKYFMKFGVCDHLLRITKLNSNDEFLSKGKNGGQKKQNLH